MGAGHREGKSCVFFFFYPNQDTEIRQSRCVGSVLCIKSMYVQSYKAKCVVLNIDDIAEIDWSGEQSK